MANDLKFGIQTNGVKHGEADGMPDIDTRFRMVRDAGVFDYIDKTPAPDEVEQFRKASAKYGLPVRAGGWYYTLGGDDADLLRHNLELAKDLGSVVHNVQVTVNDAAGAPVTDQDVADFYLYAYEIGAKLGVEPCFEVHINMWSEDFRRVAPVAARRGAAPAPDPRARRRARRAERSLVADDAGPRARGPAHERRGAALPVPRPAAPGEGRPRRRRGGALPPRGRDARGARVRAR